MSGWIGVVPGSEVPVEGRDDGVLLSFLHILPEGRHTGCFQVVVSFKSYGNYFKEANFHHSSQQHDKNSSCIVIT